MSGSKITRDQARETIRAVEDALRKGYRPMGIAGSGPNAVGAAAHALGLSGPTTHNRLLSAQRQFGIAPDWSIWKPTAVGAIDAPEARAIRRLESQVGSLTAQLKAANKALDADDRVRSQIFRLAEIDPAPPDWLTRPAKRSGSETPILFTSDFQWGEVVKPGNIGGVEVNEFNIAVARRRYRKLIEKTCHLLFDLQKRPRYDGLVYLRGGDMISGEIHDELAETNELQAIPAVKDLLEVESWGIAELRRRFGAVHVISVPGNHGRTTRKPHAKKYADHNYDTLGAWMLEREFRGDGKVTFQTPLSGDAVFQIYRHRYLLHHGDRMGSSGGQGFIGPAAVIAKGHKKLSDQQSQLNQPVDCIFTGHFHTSLKMELGYANGCLPGFTEFARDIRVVPKAPSQWLFTSHPDRPIAQMWEIELDKRPRLAAPANDLAETMRRKAA